MALKDRVGQTVDRSIEDFKDFPAWSDRKYKYLSGTKEVGYHLDPIRTPEEQAEFDKKKNATATDEFSKQKAKDLLDEIVDDPSVERQVDLIIKLLPLLSTLPMPEPTPEEVAEAQVIFAQLNKVADTRAEAERLKKEGKPPEDGTWHARAVGKPK